MRKFVSVLVGVILAASMVMLVNPTGASAGIAPVAPVAPAEIAPLSASFTACTFGQGCLYVDHDQSGAVYHVVFSVVHGNNCITLLGTALYRTMSSSIETIGSGWHFRFYSGDHCDSGFFDQPDNTEAEWNPFHEDLAGSFKLVQ